DVHDTGGLRADGDLVHVEHRGWVVHGVAVSGGDDGDGVRAPLGHQGGAVDRVHGDVDLRAVAGADVLTVEQHRGLVLLALADHDHAVHVHGVDELAHRVHGCTVTLLLHATADPATR